MTHLTVPQVLFIHSRVLAETGGSAGIRDFGALLSAVMRPQMTFDGQALYPDLFTRTAALMESLVSNHPFVDGNKRVGIVAAGLMLRLNGYHLDAGQEELERFVLAVAERKKNLSEIAGWLRKKARRSRRR